MGGKGWRGKGRGEENRGGTQDEKEADVQMGTVVPSTGNVCVKNATSGGAPWKMTSV